MAVSLKHTTQAVGTDAGNGEIGKTQWNEEHTLTMATGKLLGRSTAGTGAAEEITVGTGLSLSGGSLTATGSQNTFTTFAVAGQSDVVADSTTDTLTLAAGSNITITTNATTDTITIAASGGGTAAGSDTQVQFNDGGTSFGGDAGLTYNKTTNALTIASGSLNFGGSSSGTVTIQPAAAAGTYTLTLPTGTGTNGQALLTDGSGGLSWGAVGGTPGGADAQVQFNDGGAFGGDSDLTWNKTTNTLTLTSGSLTMTGNISAAAWTTSGIRHKNVSATLTDTTSTGTVAAAYTNVYGGNTIAASNTTTFTDYFTTFINPPTAGTNVTFTRNWALGLGGGLQIESASRLGWSTDLILTRRGAANLRLGAADAAAPVAQTLSVQSVVAGTSNTAGANLTITGSQGTGTGAGGSIIFQTAPAGSSGTAQNALVNRLTIPASGTPFAFAGAATGSIDLTCSTFAQLFARGGGVNMNIGAGFSIGIVGTENGYPLEVRTSNATRLTFGTTGGLTIADANDIAVGSTTGSKIGTATSQKIGFWNATPIVQPTTAVAAATVAATGTGDVVAASTTFDGYTIPQIVKALRNAGLLA